MTIRGERLENWSTISEPVYYRQRDELIFTSRAKCAGCKKTKLINGFSKKQQEILVHDLANKSNKKAPASPAIVRCRKCNGGVVQELLCSVCQIVKGLDAFTKFQRSQPDQAVGAPIFTQVASLHIS